MDWVGRTVLRQCCDQQMFLSGTKLLGRPRMGFCLELLSHAAVAPMLSSVSLPSTVSQL